MTHTQTPEQTPGEDRSMRRRRHWAIALIISAAVLGFFATFAVWANRQAFDTDQWTQTSSELLENDEIRAQVANYLVDELYANVDVQAQITQALPPRLDPLAAPIAGAVRNFAEKAANELLLRPRVQKAWEISNRDAHRTLIRILAGGDTNVSTQNGVVVLDLKSILQQTSGRLGIAQKVSEKLPPSAGQITILKSNQLEFAQNLADLMKGIAWVLTILTLGLFALAVYIARGWRREALRAVGFSFIGIGALVLMARSLAGSAVVDSLVATASVKPAAQAVWDISTSLLQDMSYSLIVDGIVIVAAAWLAGPTRSAVGTRRWMAPVLREGWIAFGILALALLLVFAWGPTTGTSRLLPSLIMIVLVVSGFIVLRRQAQREFPDASFAEAGDTWRGRWQGVRDRASGGRSREAPSEAPTEAAAPSTPEAAAGRRLEVLEGLATLRDKGVITPEEFEAQKAEILRGDQS